jgi:nuclear pore complex protein Nup210
VLQENLIVSGGTCSLDASTNDTHVVQIVKHPGKSLCSQLILGANGLGKAIQDVGLSPRATTYSLVHFFGTFFLDSLDTFCIKVNQAPSVAYYVCTGEMVTNLPQGMVLCP